MYEFCLKNKQYVCDSSNTLTILAESVGFRPSVKNKMTFYSFSPNVIWSTTETAIFNWGTVLNCIYLDLNIIRLVNKNCYLKPNIHLTIT